MFKKLLSVLTVMLFVFSMNAGAQELQKATFGKAMPRYAAKNLVTSKIDLAGNEFWTGYWDGEFNDNTRLIGVKKVPMTYGCAVKYPASSRIAKDKMIEGVKFLFADVKNIKDVKIFMSTKPIAMASEADICVEDVKEYVGVQDGANEVRFSTPYKFDSSKDLYIGYFFKVARGNGDYEQYPVMIQSGVHKRNSIFLSFNGESMDDYYELGFDALALQVLMDGVIADNDADIDPELPDFTGTKDSFDLPVTVENVGTKGLSSLELEVTVGDVKTTAEVKAPSTVLGTGNAFSFKVKANTPSEPRSYKYTVKIVKINGMAVTDEISGTGTIRILSKLVEPKVVVEEFTGMWCGWCPRGAVALEKLSRTFGDKVVRIAAHYDDILATQDYINVIQACSGGFPTAAVARTIYPVDPFYGSSQGEFGIKDDVLYCMKNNPVAEIVSKPTLEGNVVKANSETTFLYTGDASNYAVAYVLIEDEMTGTGNSWAQNNNYAGRKEKDPLFKRWTSGKPKMKVSYSEVAIAAKGIELGVTGSIPAEVTDGVANVHTVEFDLDKYGIIQDKDQLSVATLLIDKTTGQIINADSTPLNPEKSGIEEVEGTDKVVETARYTIDGRRISKPEEGINIVKYSDGTVKKVIVK